MLQVLLGISIGLLLWGLMRLWLDGISHAEAKEALRQLQGPVTIAVGVIRAEPVALLCLGIAALVVTPLLRLVLLLIDFAWQRDWFYASVCLGVTVVIAVGFVLRLH